MIIECVKCNKKFNVDAKLIPEKGRQIQCGLCDHIWYFKVEDSLKKPLIIDNKNSQENISDKDYAKKNTENPIEEKTTVLVKDNDIKKNNKINKNTTPENNVKIRKIGVFFSYLLVFIISFVALIILLDTLKSTLINVFPSLEIVLFNLFETLKDIRLFIIDLT